MTSAKPGNGVELLRDNSLDTYWQSDGAQPHLVNVQFQKKVRVRELCIYADYRLDESYTPNKISVRAGNSFHDLREIKTVDLDEPSGWTRVSSSRTRTNPGLSTAATASACERTFCKSPCSRTTRTAGTRTCGRSRYTDRGRDPEAMIGQGMQFTTAEYGQFATVR